jgi:peptidoglycan/LPS O-acetylase OafA/YrhL
MTATVPRASSSAARVATDFRPEIQGLRALAVVAVLLFHLWSAWVPGGYVGVDVFFVVSGYLITAHLLKEADATGRIDVPAFWARRIRRLLPASFLVLLATVAIVLVAVPSTLKVQWASDVAAAAAYVVNWVFAASSIDYLAQDDLPSVVQHYWSLSVEEQFYVLWPLLLVSVLLLRGRAPVAVGRALVVLPAALLVLSLAASVVLTELVPGPAYFNTGVRAWEFLAGGVVAASARHWLQLGGTWRHRRVGVIAAWIGVAMILVAVFLYTDETPFPGIAAVVPVAGTALAIAAGGNGGPLSLRRVSLLPPIRLLGDWSYSIYLWHWPMIMLFPLVAGQPVTTPVALAIVVASIALGALSKRWVEDPLRRPWGRKLRREFLVALLVPALLIGGATALNIRLQERIAAAQAAQDAKEAAPCFGVRAVLSTACPGDPYEVTEPVDTVYAAADLDVGGWCLTQLLEEWRTCTFGDPDGPRGTIAFVGDSHAAAMVPALDKYFAEEGWRVESFFRFGCPAVTREPIEIGWPRQQIDSCQVWSNRVIDELVARDDISIVAFTDFTEGYYLKGTDPGRVREADVRSVWTEIIDSGKTVVWIDDVPGTNDIDIPTCLAAIEVPVHGPCSLDRRVAMKPTDIRAAAASTPGVISVELADLFCDAERCYSVIGGAVAYADNNHLSGTYARSISDVLGDRMMSQVRAAAD